MDEEVFTIRFGFDEPKAALAIKSFHSTFVAHAGKNLKLLKPKLELLQQGSCFSQNS